MAFTPDTISIIVQPIGGEGMRFVSYKTDDDQASVTATDYFLNAERYGIKLSDLIFVSPVSVDFDSYVLVVTSIDADGNVTASIGDNEMLASVYDPQGIAADAFDRANQTGEQDISTVTGLQDALDAKLTSDGALKLFAVRVLDASEGAPASDYEAGDTIDGVTLVAGDSVLRATDGGDPADGVYVVPASGAASRLALLNAYDNFPGVFFSVTEGTSNADTLWRCTSNAGGALDATDIVISEFSSGAVVDTEAKFLSALGGVGAIRVASGLSSVTLTTSTQVDDLRAKFHLIIPEGPIEITLPAGTFAYSATELFKFAHHSSLITLRGATPVETTLTSVASVTGSAYDWDVVLNVASGTGIAVGDILKLWNVGPLPSLSGDNAFLLRDMPIDNEIFTPHVRIGAMTITAGTNTATFTSGTLSNHIEVDDLFHRGGQTNQVASIDDGTRTITFDDNWTFAAAGELCYLVTKPGLGSCTLSGSQPSSTLDFANGITGSHLNAGGMILTRGLSIKIESIVDGNTVDLSHAVSFTGGAPYSIVTPGTLHEGGWRVTTVSGNQITVKNRCATKPPVNNVAGGEVIAIKTVLHQTGTGDGAFPVGNNSAITLEDIAFRGSYASAGSHGIAGNGRDAVYGPTQNGICSAVRLGYNTAVIDFGRNYYGTYGCVLNARGTMWTGARESNVWADVGSDVNLRHCVAAGALTSDGIIYGPGSRGKTTETRSNGNFGDGFQTFMGAENYGEIPFCTGNLGMGSRIQGGQSDCGQMVSQLNGLSGIYISEPGGNVKMPNSLILCNSREGVEVDGLTHVNAKGSFIAGTSGTAGSGYTINARNGAVVQADNISAGGNKLGLYSTTGAQIDAHAHAPSLAIAGVTRANEYDLRGSIIRTSAALATGVPALAVDGGSSLSFFKMATAVFDFPSIADGASSSTTVTVSGATTTNMCAFANSNSVPSGLTLSACISAASTVTVTATNNSGGALDAGNATLTVIVIGAT